jgi:hypothetical protein
MASADWRLEGDWVKNCSCAYGCPCDFNARPTEGYCKGLVAMHIRSGHYDAVRLDDLTFCVTVHFPGALHEGNGQAQPIIDARASPAQRDALFAIMSGQNSQEGTLFNIFSLIVSVMHEPIFAPIHFEFDQRERVARIIIPGVLTTEVEPIKNPVTGAALRATLVLPEGFEHREGEIASSNIDSSGAIAFATKGKHSTLAHVIQSPAGVLG